MWTDNDEKRLTELHAKIEASGFRRSNLTRREQDEVDNLELKWTALHDFHSPSEFPHFT